MIKSVLIHRYDNTQDIRAAERFGCSEVYQYSNRTDFQLVIITPTSLAGSNRAVVADAISRQYCPRQVLKWPGGGGPYFAHVDLANFRPVTAARVRILAESAGINWVSRWQVNDLVLEEDALFRTNWASGPDSRRDEALLSGQQLSSSPGQKF